jgi:hypothetical protein
VPAPTPSPSTPPDTTGMLNVKEFGAVGDGIADDTDAINRAFAAVHAQKKSLYFPSGTYRCDKMDAYSKILSLDGGGLSDVTIVGDGSTSHITTSVSAESTLFYIWAYAKNSNFKITGLKFSSTHAPATQFYQNGLFLQGTPGSNFQNAAITSTEFSGFGNTIGAQGIDGFKIDQNNFVAPRGHDDSQGSNKPAVYIWMHDNQNGLCRNVTISNNTASGYSSTGPIGSLITKRAMDGFIYGTAYGLTITGNSTGNFSQEHVAIGVPVTVPDTTAPTLISNNAFNGAIPVGSFTQEGGRNLSNYGIRSDASYVTIEKNVMKNMTLGILVRTIDNPTLYSKSISIANNTISTADDPANYAVSSAIYVVGGVANTVNDLRIDGNKISSGLKSAGGYQAVFVTNVNGATVINNQVDQLVLQGSNQTIGTAFAYKNAINVVHRDNLVSGPLIPLTGL